MKIFSQTAVFVSCIHHTAAGMWCHKHCHARPRCGNLSYLFKWDVTDSEADCQSVLPAPRGGGGCLDRSPAVAVRQ